ncbi:MAG: class I SAM-dependent methyltransferase [Actinomycetota bacterium]|nr:MAG: class I SAM-dependent methyltransferase [Actinomycetota bacterium]
MAQGRFGAIRARAFAVVRRLRRARAYRGNRVECPLCGGHFDRFMPVKNRTNAKCPRCAALERHRRVGLFLRERTDLFDAKLRVLHIAPERSLRRTLGRLEKLDYLTGDLYAHGVDLQLDITAIDFPDDSFDVILCSHVLEHVTDDRVAMAEFARILRPAGWAVLNVPCDPNRTEIYEDASIVDPAERAKHFGQRDHVRWYTVDGFAARLTESGFTVEVDPMDFTAEQRARYALDGDAYDHLFFCRPRPAPASPQ